MIGRCFHADVTVSGDVRFCAEHFGRGTEFERHIVVNGVAVTADSISFFRSDDAPGH
jgi:hypothetical protein